MRLVASAILGVLVALVGSTDAQLPVAFDGRKFMPPVRTGSVGCKDSVAFAAIAAAEGAAQRTLNLKSDSVNLSEAALFHCDGELKCDKYEWNDMYSIADALTAVSPYNETEYPNGSNEKQCTQLSKKRRSKYTFGYENMYDSDDIKTWLNTTGFAMSCFDLYADFPAAASKTPLNNPQTGNVYVYDGTSAKIGSHCVAVVGWDDAKDAWLVRNSWGKNWNGNGHIWMKYGTAGIGDSIGYKLFLKPNLPSSFDLRNVKGQNYMPPVRDQEAKQCASSIVFGAVAAAEGTALRTLKLKNTAVDFSEAALKLCSGLSEYCPLHEGSTYYYASFAANALCGSGLYNEDVFEFNVDAAKCPPQIVDGTAPRSGFEFKQTLMENREIKSWIAETGPVLSCFKVFKDFPAVGKTTVRKDYVYKYNGKSAKSFAHCVSIIGWNDQKGAWLVRNSWGAKWNGDGHIWMKYGTAGLPHPESHIRMNSVGFQLTKSPKKPINV
jgi:C1A family cysteine protease